MVSDADYVTGHLADFFYSSSWSVGSHGFSMNTLRSVLRVTRSYSLVGRLSMSISGFFFFSPHSNWSACVFTAWPSVDNLYFIPKGVFALAFQIVCHGIHNHLKCLNAFGSFGF